MAPEHVALLGVAVGAVLGGLAQVLAGTLEAQRSRRRHDRDLTRETYVDFVSSVDAERTAVLRMTRATGQEERNAAYAEYQEAFLARANALTRLSLYAPAAIQEAAVEISTLLTPTDGAIHGTEVTRRSWLLLSDMRADLGLAGSVCSPDDELFDMTAYPTIRVVD